VGTYETCVDVLQCKAMLYETRRIVGYNAAPGETNAVTFSRSPNVVTVRDSGAPVTPGTGCTSVSPNEAACTVDATFFSAGASLGDGNDTLAVAGSFVKPVSGGGGPGNDQLTGGDEVNRFDGGAGLDTVSGGAGDDELDGGLGVEPDSIDGGAGRDEADYSTRTNAVNVALTRIDGQGEEAENDKLAGIEDVTGGEGADVLRGDDSANRLAGGNDGDTLSGAGGADVLTGDAGADSFSGGTGNDTIRSHDYEGRPFEPVKCGSGRDTVADNDLNGGEYGGDTRFFGPDLRDTLSADCERSLLTSEEKDQRVAFNPRLRRLSAAALAIANPCRTAACEGRVSVTIPGKRKPLATRNFARRGRLVRIRTSPAADRAVRRAKVVIVKIRLVTEDTSSVLYAASYRTRPTR
jgi:hypothetical protein